MEPFICVVAIFGIMAVIVFLSAHTDERRRFVGRMFVLSGFIGLCFHVYSLAIVSREANIRLDNTDVIANIYFVVIVYFFCCYLHFSNLPPRRGQLTKRQVQSGRALPENILDDPEFPSNKTTED